MRVLRSEIEIDAPPERFWQVLTDFEAYPEWNGSIPRQRSAVIMLERRAPCARGRFSIRSAELRRADHEWR